MQQGDRKQWRAMEARAKRLPRDYRVGYGEMKSYLWRFTAGDGMNIVAILKDVLDLFEAGAASARDIRDITGADVAAFCDERLRGTTSYLDRYEDRWRASLNRTVATKLAE
jgi:DNA-binding ferritin-like protein (Dps family)